MKALIKIFLSLSILFCALQANAQIITTWAGGGYRGNYPDPNGACFDKWGNFYVAEYTVNKIHKVDTDCNFTTIAGTGIAGYNGDSILAINAQLDGPSDVTTDSAGNIYISDVGNFRIRKIEHATGIITTIVGTGTWGYNGDNIPAITAQLKNATGICFDKQGNLYISEADGYRVRKVNTFGIISTFAGNGIGTCTVNGGLADTSSIPEPSGICSDTGGNIYIGCVQIPHIFKVNSSGLITIFAGTGTFTAYNGDNIPATTAQIVPTFIKTDISGNVFFTDGDNRIRMIDTFGIINTFAGNGTTTHTGDNGPANLSGISNPGGLGFDHCGNLYVAEIGGPAFIRKIAIDPTCGDTLCGGPHPTIVSSFYADNGINIYPNPATDHFTISYPGILTQDVRMELYNITGRMVFTVPLKERETIIPTSSLAVGIYICKIITWEKELIVKKLLVEK